MKPPNKLAVSFKKIIIILCHYYSVSLSISSIMEKIHAPIDVTNKTAISLLSDT